VSAFTANLLVFGRLLRAAGIDVPVGHMLDLIEALTQVDVGNRTDVFCTCRTLLVRRPDQLELFAQIFDAFWRDHANPFAGRDAGVNAADETARPGAATAVDTTGDESTDDDSGEPALTVFRTWSDLSTLAHKDFAEFSEAEVRRAQLAMDRLVWVPGHRRTRRWIRGRGPRLDLRGALAGSMRTGGEVVRLPTRRRRVRPRPLVLLCDVSGSMERYSRLLLHFAHGVGQRHNRLEVFLFSTSLTRVTHELRTRHVNDAAAAVADVVSDWSGGTRIGVALQHFHRRWSRRVLRQGPVVLLVSDGWDLGDPDLLRDQVARLQRSCHRLVWLNPLIGTTGYEPLTRALQAALPFVDDFLPVRTLADLGDLALHLETIAAGAPPRRLQHRT
jgi:uncharacterized protein